MPVNTADFMSVADNLIASSPCQEIHYRSAVNRAYYAAFHEALVTADHLKLSRPEGAYGDHKKLVKRFSTGGKRLKIMADRIDKIRAARNRADYEVHHRFTQKDANTALSSCKSVLADVIKLRTPLLEEA